MKTIKALIILIILVAAGAVAYAYSGLYNVAVGTGHNPVTEWFLEFWRERSIEARAKDIAVPGDLDSEARIQAGAGHYQEMCAACHGFPGQQPADVFEPSPPALYNDVPEPAEAFWIIRNGIKMSAMPNHLDHSEADVWNIVAFLQKLPSMTPADYEAITADAEHIHADGQGHGQDTGEPGMEAAAEDAQGAGHAHDAPMTPEATVHAFHHALEEGDAEAALALLHANATILEGGALQTKEQYAAGHLAQDIEFMQQVEVQPLTMDEKVIDGQATVTSSAQATGTIDGEAVDLVLSETATLIETEAGWRIVQLNWATSPANEMTGQQGGEDSPNL